MKKKIKTISDMARLGGLARAKKMSKKQRSEMGKKMAEKRWGKVRK